MCFIFPMIYYGFAHIASVKSSTGKEGKYPTKKSILPKMPRSKSHCHRCELSTLIKGLRSAPVFRFLSVTLQGRGKSNTMNHYLAMYESPGQPNSCVT